MINAGTSTFFFLHIFAILVRNLFFIASKFAYLLAYLRDVEDGTIGSWIILFILHLQLFFYHMLLVFNLLLNSFRNDYILFCFIIL